MGGVRMPEIDVPLGAYAGWNLRAASIGNPDRMIAFIGSYFPFDSAEVKKRYSGQADISRQHPSRFGKPGVPALRITRRCRQDGGARRPALGCSTGNQMILMKQAGLNETRPRSL